MEITAPPLCPCGQPVDSDLLAIRGMFPSLSPDLCSACYAIACREDEERTRADIEQADHRRRLARLDSVIPAELLATSLSHPQFSPALWVAVAGWSPESGRWLLIEGEPGRCKSRVVGLIAKKLILDGRHLAWCRATDFQQRVEELWIRTRGIPESAYEQLRQWKTAGILVIDDLGKNNWTSHIEEKLFDLIDHRKSHLLPTIVTSNSPVENLVDVLSEDRGGPLVGRILEASAGWRIKAPEIPSRSAR